MPQNKNSQRPEVMTWGRATPALVGAVVFDALRIFFSFFWFFGPTLAGVYCTTKVGEVMVVGKMLASGCVATAGLVGFFSAPSLAAFGTVMAMATGLSGWLLVGSFLWWTNARIFKENEGNALWFVGSLMVSEVPFVGAIPAFTGTLWRLYSVQIKKEKVALQKWEAAHAAELNKERALKTAQMQQAQLAQQQAANDAAYEQAAALEQEEQLNEPPSNIIRLPSRKPREPLAGVPQYTQETREAA